MFCSLLAFPVAAYLWAVLLDFVKQNAHVKGAHEKRWAASRNASEQGETARGQNKVIPLKKLYFSPSEVASLYNTCYLWSKSLYQLYHPSFMKSNPSGLQDFVFCPVGDEFCSMISTGVPSMLEMQLPVFSWSLGSWVWSASWSQYHYTELGWGWRVKLNLIIKQYLKVCRIWRYIMLLLNRSLSFSLYSL